MRKPHYILLSFSIIILLASTLTSCSGGGQTHSSGVNMANQWEMPTAVRSAPVIVQEAYQFAAANPEILERIPCYCGCGAMGHTSNYSCYFSGQSPDGSLTFEPHALGCSICVDITQDTMRLLKQGKDLPEIRSYIDETYSRFGPSNIP